MKKKGLTPYEIEENKKTIIRLLYSTGRRNIDRVVKYLCDSSFFYSWGSYRHHKYKGGLAEHSLHVCQTALKNNNECDRSSIIICGILHDICKATYSKLPKRYLYGHGDKSAAILVEYLKVPLSVEEYNAIRFHMTVFGNSLSTYEKEQFKKAENEELWKLIHTSDWFDAGGYSSPLFGIAKALRGLIK